ncbi:hypothetical protein [Microbacterium kunmingense]|uniref:hypothetical protein n=1 Tax=Microbacterium kunmingense TaxID=2915939 RepID=UPI003D71712F
MTLPVTATVMFGGLTFQAPVEYGTAIRDLPDGEVCDHEHLWSPDDAQTADEAWESYRAEYEREADTDTLASQELLLVWRFKYSGEGWRMVPSSFAHPHAGHVPLGETRTVHGVAADGAEIVRYERAGKWFVEPGEGKRRAVSLSEAAALAVAGTSYSGRSGGGRFDAAVRKLSV